MKCSVGRDPELCAGFSIPLSYSYQLEVPRCISAQLFQQLDNSRLRDSVDFLRAKGSRIQRQKVLHSGGVLLF